MVITNNNFNKIQKNRFIKSPKKIKLKFGDSAIICKNEGRIELIHISILKKKLKTFIQKKKSEIDIIREKIWYFGRPNFLIQKKSKNSRMGKGKGLIERKTIRIRQNFVLFEFKGVSKIRIRKLISYSNKILSVKFYFMSDFNKNYSLWSKQNKYTNYHEKYLLQ